MRLCLICGIALIASLWLLLGEIGLIMALGWLAIVSFFCWWGERIARIEAEKHRDHWLSRYTDTTDTDLDGIIDRECCR